MSSPFVTIDAVSPVVAVENDDINKPLGVITPTVRYLKRKFEY